jgi:hypothetical protein
MAWQQTGYPNLDNDPIHPLYVYVGGQLLYDWYCWCLAVCLASVGSGWTADCAWTAWEVNPNKHFDYDIPDGVFVFIYYKGGAYGHVAIARRSGAKVQIWSSPYTHKATYDYFEGDIQVINKVGAIYGVSYVGWSETIGDTAIAKYVAPAPATPAPEPTPEPEPEPEPVEPIPDPVIDESNNNGDGEGVEPVNKEEYEEMEKKNKEIAAQMLNGIGELVDTAGDVFSPTPKQKLIAYLIGDFLLVVAMEIPLVINCITAPDINTFGTALATAISELGAAILLIFKLVKKK